MEFIGGGSWRAELGGAAPSVITKTRNILELLEEKPVLCMFNNREELYCIVSGVGFSVSWQ